MTDGQTEDKDDRILPDEWNHKKKNKQNYLKFKPHNMIIYYDCNVCILRLHVILGKIAHK